MLWNLAQAAAYGVLMVALLILTVDDAQDDHAHRGVIVTSTFLVNIILMVCATILLFG